MDWKQILGTASSAVTGGLLGTGALVWFLSGHPLVALRLIPPSGVLRVNRSVETITAKRFVLVNDHGRTLAALGTETDGSVGLTMVSVQGNKASLTVDDGGSKTEYVIEGRKTTFESIGGAHLFLGNAKEKTGRITLSSWDEMDLQSLASFSANDEYEFSFDLMPDYDGPGKKVVGATLSFKRHGREIWGFAPERSARINSHEGR
jgi:hypothetical protein